MPKTLIIEAFETGTIIDHIPAGQGRYLLDLLCLETLQKPLTLGAYLESERMGKKDILKIPLYDLNQRQLSKIAIFAPNATINLVRNHEIIEKFSPTLPEVLDQILGCPNPRCITQDEFNASTFKLIQERNQIFLSCHYCEKIFTRSEIKKYVRSFAS
jgi:aspartate carbamoyltransferase regulatory subunit